MVSGMLCEHLCPDTHLFHGVSALLIPGKAINQSQARLTLAAVRRGEGSAVACGVFNWKVGICNGRKKGRKRPLM